MQHKFVQKIILTALALLRSPKDPTWFIFEAAEILENIRIGLISKKYLGNRGSELFLISEECSQQEGETEFGLALPGFGRALLGIRACPTWNYGRPNLEFELALSGIWAGPIWSSG
jgi:hypothetical protein